MRRDIRRYSHKALKELGSYLNGFCTTCNIYEYENILHDVQAYFNRTYKNYELNKGAVKIAEQIKEKFPTVKYAVAWQIGYSAGVCGNTGQIHRIDIQDENGKIGEVFMYV